MKKASQVRFAVIGIGTMGFAHTGYITAARDCVLKAVCDVDPATFDKLTAEQRKSIRCYTRAEECLRDPEIDAVMIATPHYFHPDLAIAALKHGKHIIVEKPIAVQKFDAERLLAEGAAHPELVQSLMLNQRTLPAHIKVKELIDSGELGVLRRLNWVVTDWFRPQCYYDSGEWRASWRGEGGGVLLNQCPHQLDLLQWFFGMPARVRAFVKLGKYHDIEVEDEVNAYLEYADGRCGNFISSTGEAPGVNRLEILGERGLLTLENNQITLRRNEVEMSEFNRTSKERFSPPECWTCSIPVPPASGTIGHQRIIENVVQTILGREKLIAPLADGIRELEIGNAMLYSGLTDTTVELPLDSAAYKKMLEKLIRSSRWKPKKSSGGK